MTTKILSNQNTITINKIKIPIYEDYNTDTIYKQTSEEFLKDQINKQSIIQENMKKFRLNEPKFIDSYQSLHQLTNQIKSENKHKNILSKIVSLIYVDKQIVANQMHISQLRNQIDELKMSYHINISNFESEFLKLRTIMYKDIIELEQMMNINNLK